MNNNDNNNSYNEHLPEVAAEAAVDPLLRVQHLEVHVISSVCLSCVRFLCYLFRTIVLAVYSILMFIVIAYLLRFLFVQHLEVRVGVDDTTNY